MSGYYPPGPFEIQWVLVDELAKSPRPGYPERQGIGTDEVDDWIEEIRGMGIRSIICFLSDDQLPFYSGLPSGLIQYYRDAGFDVAHIPEDDYKTPPLTAALESQGLGWLLMQSYALIHENGKLASISVKGQQ